MIVELVPTSKRCYIIRGFGSMYLLVVDKKSTCNCMNRRSLQTSFVGDVETHANALEQRVQ